LIYHFLNFILKYLISFDFIFSFGPHSFDYFFYSFSQFFLQFSPGGFSFILFLYHIWFALFGF
jgi:hypothetical protein